MPFLLDELKALFVEPSTAQRKIIEKNLRETGLKDIEWITRGKDALDILKNSKIDLVISAMYLDDMTGTDLILKIRTGDYNRDVPYILISSETQYRYLEPIRQAGAIAILSKPYEKEQLEKALFATLDFFEQDELQLHHIALDEVKVLLVDDSDISRRHMRHILNNIGLDRVTEALNGREGLSCMKEQYFDLIVTDLYMPEMDGKEFVEQIRNHSAQTSVPILMVSSETNESRLAGVREAGVSAICDKPFEPNTVKQLIERILN
jgi:two-component system chemotaxis response regulator CheY